MNNEGFKENKFEIRKIKFLFSLYLDSFIFYGISPHHDTFRIIKCKECNKIISLTYFNDHLG